MIPVRAIINRRTRGMTYIEVMIAAGIVLFVMAFLVYITILQGRKSNYIATVGRAESQVRVAAEFIRYRMVMGRFGSASVSNNGRTLTFNDPNNGSAVSTFIFQSNSGNLVYDNDPGAAPNPYRTLKGLHDVVFTTHNNGAIVEATVTAQAQPFSTATPRPTITIEQTVKVYLRN